MSILENLNGSYCKIALSSSHSESGIVQTGFVKDVDINKKIITLENEHGVVQLPFDHIRAVKKVRVNQDSG